MVTLAFKYTAHFFASRQFDTVPGHFKSLHAVNVQAQKQLAEMPPIPDHSARMAQIAQQMNSVREQVSWNVTDGPQRQLCVRLSVVAFCISC